jgi:hypothetical protein
VENNNKDLTKQIEKAEKPSRSEELKASIELKKKQIKNNKPISK